MSRHLDLIHQFAGTNGHCHLWALAIRELYPEARIVALYAKDPRTFKAHDWPEEEPLELHQFAILPDGRAVDAQGIHADEEMVRKFGMKRGYRYEIADVGPDRTDMTSISRTKPAWHESVLLYARVLTSLGWKEELPAYDGELERNWKAVLRQVDESGIPDPEEPTAALAL